MAHTIATIEEKAADVSKILEEETITSVGKDTSHSFQPSEPKEPQWKPLSRRQWVLLAIALVAIAALSWLLYARQFESTDDAQIDGHIDVISSRIPGTVVFVNPKVENNQYVEAGTLIAELDPTDYLAALDHAKADLATRQAAARSAQINVPITGANAFSQLNLAEASLQEALATVQTEEANLAAAQHKVRQDEALYTRADRDRTRWQKLADEGVFSRSDSDAREAEALADAQMIETDRALVAAIQQKVAAAKSLVEQRRAQVAAARTAPQQVSNAQAQVESSTGQVGQAQADVHTAELNLGYTKIYAPVSGVIGRKTVELGQRIQPGQSLLAIVPVNDIWVTANFKETQLAHMQPGQPVTIHVDAFNRDYQGTVENLPGAAGTLFSLLPPENATGNYVKVVQRLPVRVRFNPDQDPTHMLRPGMSVEPSVRVR
jgi:membrane fusion protein (multidrug efflux system)